jgi:sRNA-binding protein
MSDPTIESPEPTEPVAQPVPTDTEIAAQADAPAAPELAEPEVAAAADSATDGQATKPAELSPAACGAKLAELFPALFGPEGPPKPLKLKIQADIQERAPGVFTRKGLGIFFSRYTTGNAYLKALLNAPHRYDLDGQPAGEIAEEHKAAATEELARRRGIAEQKRAAEREARRAEEKAAFKARQKTEREAQKTQVVEDQARRDRAFLLRAFETSSLTKANFCALKGVSETELDAQLEQARKERAERPPMPPRQDRPGLGPRPDHRHGSRPAR